jgi:hypothetical protein
MGRVRLAVSSAVLVVCAVALSVAAVPQIAMGTSASATTSVWLQTMDSCQSALGGAGYQLVGGGLDLRVSTPGAGRTTVASGGGCPLQQGNCASITAGCVQLGGLPPGSYRIHETVTPPGDSSNPEGYAACNGGSACQSQEVDLIVSPSGAAATVTNVYPDGSSATYPTASAHSGTSTYPGTADDPIVVHNFGLAPPDFNGNAQCDDDGDADDHSTGSPSSHCQYPEGQESAACQPYPWSCTLAPTTSTTSTTSSSTSSATTTSTTTTSSSSTTTTTTTTTTTSSSPTTSSTTSSCNARSTFSGRLRKGSTSQPLSTATSGPLSVMLSWDVSAAVRLTVVDGSSHTLGQTSATGRTLSLSIPGVRAGTYRLKMKLSGARSVAFTLTATHC